MMSDSYVMTRKEFLGCVAGVASLPVLGSTFADLRSDKSYMWKWNRGRLSFCTWGHNGRNIVRNIMIDMAYTEKMRYLNEYISDVASNNLSLAQFPMDFRWANGGGADVPWRLIKGECELEIPVTSDWLVELYRRHKYDI